MTTAVSVGELQRAWAAVTDGEFRTGTTDRRRRVRTSAQWSPDESVIVVAGAAGRAGTSTVALAVATASDESARVIECAPMFASGLANATTAELGVTAAGWRQGNRDQILIERTSTPLDGPHEVPLPEPTDRKWSVLDVGWNLPTLVHGDSWLTSALASAPLILVTAATVPGLRAMDHALQLAGRSEATWCVITGLRPKKWPKPLQLATTPTIKAVIDDGRLVTTPHSSTLSVAGLTPDPLPPQLVAACQPMLDQIVEARRGTNHHVQP